MSTRHRSKKVRPGICLLNAAAKLMRRGRLTDRPGCVRLFHGPSLEGRSETMHRSPVSKAGLTKYLGQGHVTQHPAGPQRGREAQAGTVFKFTCEHQHIKSLGAQGHPMLCARFHREPGIVQVAPSMSISSQVQDGSALVGSRDSELRTWLADAEPAPLRFSRVRHGSSL